MIGKKDVYIQYLNLLSSYSTNKMSYEYWLPEKTTCFQQCSVETTNLVEVELLEVHLLKVKVIFVLKLGELQGLFQPDPEDVTPPNRLPQRVTILMMNFYIFCFFSGCRFLCFDFKIGTNIIGNFFLYNFITDDYKTICNKFLPFRWNCKMHTKNLEEKILSFK